MITVSVPLALFWGCNKGGQPISPANSSSLNINLASNLNAQLLSATQNLILYNISSSSSSITGIYGPVSSSALTGQVSIGVNLPSDVINYKLISVEIVNALTQQALDIGALAISSNNEASVTLGPLNKSYYAVGSLSSGYGYGFESNTLTDVGPNTPTSVSGIDVVSNITSNNLGYELDNPALTGSTVAYMGNGNFVNYLSVPPSSSFNSSSSLSKKSILGGALQPVAVGDVYCVEMKAGGYAWLQITDAGILGISGPGFVFRINTTLPYCGYEKTTVDLAGSAVNGTPTPYAPLASSASGLFTGNVYGIAVYPSTSAALSIFVSNDPMVNAFTNTNSAYVQVLNPNLTANTTFANGTNWAQGIAVNSTGTTFYVASTYSQGAPTVQMYGGTGITSIGPAGAGTTFIPPDLPTKALAGQMGAPEFVAVAPNSGIYPNGLFVTDSATNGVADVLVFNPPAVGAAATYWNGQIGTSTSPTGIATDGTTSYIADSGNNQIETYTVNGLLGNSWTTDNNPAGAVAFSGPQGIALNAAEGLLFIADTNNNRVVEMTTTGVFKATWGTWGLGTAGNFNLPVAIAVDGATPPNVYVADSANKRVLEFKAL